MVMRVEMERTNKRLFNYEKLSGYKKLIETVRAGKSCSIFGVQNSMRAALASSFGGKLLFVTADDVTANSFASQFEIMGLRSVLFPSVPDTFIYKKAGTTERFAQRTKALFDILNGNFDVVICPVEALFAFLPSVTDFEENIISLKKGQVIAVEQLEKKLVQAGYKRDEITSEKGQFSRRGEVLDIYPVSSDTPFRIDFFDTEIETIKVLDLTTMKGTKELDEICICPYSDLFLTDNEILHLTEKVEKLRQKNRADADTQVTVSAQIDEIISRLERGDGSYAMDFLCCYLDDFKFSVFDYLEKSGEFVCVIDECKQVFDRLIGFEKETIDRIKELESSGLFLGQMPCLFSEKQVLENFEKYTSVAFLKITNSNRFFESQAVFTFKTSPGIKYTHNLKELSIDVNHYLAAGYRVYILSGSKEQADSVNKMLLSHDVSLKVKNSKDIFDFDGGIFEGGYESGFVLPDDKVFVIGTYDLFAKKGRSGKLKTSRENVFTVPKVGDFVVHEFHGIGVCEGVTTLSGSLGTKDYVVIRYRDGDKLYVPTTGMDLLSRFSGAEKPAKLSKIGGVEFSAVKERVKKSVKNLAINLLELYAKREKIKGFAFSEDNDLQMEFENAFPYAETEDQLVSIAEIKKDMQSSKVMDRLLCGDVGFGKTEVALRAIFKAIMDGKQVAFIAPTTILSEQHYNTAKSRMQDFGISIEVLNRFRTKEQTNKILKGIADGGVDLVCGTHRVLSEDVKFKNLGLIVLDEEQKFGVEHKEKLKSKYNGIDVLTLSATPIPRTLNMSLSGIRDISIISTPPSERLPIQTFVTEYTDALVKDAISRELARDGQVFILFNSVEKIYMFAERIKKIVPEANIIVAHGQMPSRQLENVIYDFYSKRANVLICTTIIENGIDIENANTLIVIDSDKLGLSQLYQIRGRVGRGSKMAYAYLTYEYHKSLTEEAYKRLDAISEFCEFGSGFKLAMRDLEIRGGGNIFGAEQSGHLQKVGYDLYSRMLADAVKELKGEKVSETKDVLVKVALDAYVPESYISTSEERMTLYKRISMLQSDEEIQKLMLELKENFGDVPKVVLNLMDIALVRRLSGELNATEVNSYGAEVSLVFENKDDILKSEILADALYKFRMECSVSGGEKPIIKFNKSRLCSENFALLKKFLLLTRELMNKNKTKI